MIRSYSTKASSLPFKKVDNLLEKISTSNPTKAKHFKKANSSSSSPSNKTKDNTTNKETTTTPLSSTPSEAPKQSMKSRKFGKAKYREKSINLGKDYKTLNPGEIEYTPIPPPVPTQVANLEHNLDRVLFSPGVHFLQDPRTRVFNFTPFLKKIMPVSKFDFNCLTQYITASKDTTLLQITKESPDLKFFSSTSSMTSALAQFHFWLSNNRPPNITNLSKNFFGLGASFSRGTVCPSVLMCKNQDGVYSIDADKSADKEILLSLLGHSMEKLLTTSPELFNKYHIDNSHQLTADELNKPESYHYSKIGNFLMRSQLDCYDKRLPGTGTFDLKTRAVCAVRHDISFTEKNPTGYKIIKNHGLYESFEREFFELIRSAMLKYSLQARIGNMDGIFICYHNIENIFGFQYLGLEEIDHIFHSYDDNLCYKDHNNFPPNSKLKLENIQGPIGSDSDDKSMELSSFIANQEFKASVNIWSDILNEFEKKLNHSSFRLVIKSDESDGMLYCIATPMTNDKIDEVQYYGDKLNSEMINEDEKLDTEMSDDELKSETVDDNHPNSIRSKQREQYQKITEETAHDAIGFKISRKHVFNDKVSDAVYYKPSAVDVKWEIRYKLEELSKDDARRLYKRMMKEKEEISWMDKGDDDASEQIAEYLKILRAYGNKGKLREEIWKEKDEKLTIWEPISNDRNI